MTVAVLAGAALVALPVAGPARADGSAPAAPVASQPDPESAMRAAEAQKSPVEVMDDRTDSSQTFANANGSFSYQSYMTPRWRETDSGWQPLDATLQQAASGDWSPTLSQSPLVLSGGGAGPLATMTVDGEQFTLTWPSALPAPTASGASLTYPDVLASGVDLRVSATVAGGVEETLIVKNADAAADPGLNDLVQSVATSAGDNASTDAGGNLTVTNPQGDVLVTSPAPVMWDSATEPAADPTADMDASTTTPTDAGASGGTAAHGIEAAGAHPVLVTRLAPVRGTASTGRAPGSRAHQARVAASLRQHALRLTPPHGFLTAPSTVYPVYIDPAFVPHPASGSTLHYDEVQQAYSTTSNYDTVPSAGNAVGYQGFSSPTGIERTYYSVSVPSVTHGADILSAVLNTKVTYAAAGGTNSTTVNAFSTCAISASTTWNNQPCKSTSAANPNSPSPNDSETFTTTNSSPNLTVSFPVTQGFQYAADQGFSNWTLGLFNATETNDTDFVRFADDPSFSITYDHAPAAPSGLTVSPHSTTNSAVHTASRTPTFSATLTDPDQDSLSYTFQILSGTNVVATWQPPYLVFPGHAVSYTPSSALAPGNYTWQVRSSDGLLNSPWSTQSFTVDAPTAAVPIDLQTAATDTTTPMLSGVVYDQAEDIVTGDIYLTDSSGTAVIASPTATGSVPSGTRVTYRVPDGTLTPGATYHWHMTACDDAGCSAVSPTQTFTAAAAGTPAPPAPPAGAVTANWHTADLAPEDAMSDPDGCFGTNCPVSTGVSTLQVGGDGSAHWVSAIKPDLSAIPTGSEVYSATLTLTKTGCLGDCGTDTFTVDTASSDVGSATDGVGLAQADDSDQSFSTGPEADTTVDVTDALSSWIDGNTDTGFVLAATDQSTATGGAGFTATLSVTYTTPAVPSAPTSVHATGGDGGVLVTWAAPSDSGILGDPDGDITGYTVQVRTAAGALVETATVTSGTAGVLTGLTNGTSYTVSVTAANSVGSGPAATASATPAAVPGGAATYTDAVSGYTNAQDTMEEPAGAAMSAHDLSTQAASGFAASTRFANQLEASADGQQVVALSEAAHGENDTNDNTAVSNTLAMLSSDGSTVTVYATTDETFTTVDTSTGTTQSVPGEDQSDNEYFFTASATTPYLFGSVDADEALAPVTDGADATAYSNDGTTSTDTTPSFTTGDSYQFAATPDMVSNPGGSNGNPAIAHWADKHLHTAPHNFSPGCTDFVSQALHYGGGYGYVRHSVDDKKDTHDWYFYDVKQNYRVSGTTTWTWSDAEYNYKFEHNEHAWFPSTSAGWAPGDIVYVNWNNSNSAQIDHSAIIVKMVGGNPYVAQHTNDIEEPIYKVKGVSHSWKGANPHLHFWVADPAYT